MAARGRPRDLAAYFTCRSTTALAAFPPGAMERVGLPSDRPGSVFGLRPRRSRRCTPRGRQFVAKQVGAAPASFTRYARMSTGGSRRRHVAAVVNRPAGGPVAGASGRRSRLAGRPGPGARRTLGAVRPSLGQLRAERVPYGRPGRLARTVGTARVAGRRGDPPTARPRAHPERCEQLDACWSPTRT